MGYPTVCARGLCVEEARVQSRGLTRGKEPEERQGDQLRGEPTGPPPHETRPRAPRAPPPCHAPLKLETFLTVLLLGEFGALERSAKQTPKSRPRRKHRQSGRAHGLRGDRPAYLAALASKPPRSAEVPTTPPQVLAAAPDQPSVAARSPLWGGSHAAHCKRQPRKKHSIARGVARVACAEES